MKFHRSMFLLSLVFATTYMHGMHDADAADDGDTLIQEMYTQGKYDKEANLHALWDSGNWVKRRDHPFKEPDEIHRSPDGRFQIKKDSFKGGSSTRPGALRVITLKDVTNGNTIKLSRRSKNAEERNWKHLERRPFNSACWSPDGNHIAVALKNKNEVSSIEVYAINRDSNSFKEKSSQVKRTLFPNYHLKAWDKDAQEHFDKLYSRCDSLAWSPCGNYISAALYYNGEDVSDKQKRLVVFDARDGLFVAQTYMTAPNNRGRTRYRHEWLPGRDIVYHDVARRPKNYLNEQYRAADTAESDAYDEAGHGIIFPLAQSLAIREWVKSGCPSMRDGKVDQDVLTKLVHKLWQLRNQNKKTNMSQNAWTHWHCLPREVQQALSKAIAIPQDGISLLGIDDCAAGTAIAKADRDESESESNTD